MAAPKRPTTHPAPKRWRAARSSQATHKRKGSAESRAEPWISLTDQFLLQPVQRKRAPASHPLRLSAANVVRLWAGDELTTTCGARPGPHPEAAPGLPREQGSRRAYPHAGASACTRVATGRRARTKRVAKVAAPKRPTTHPAPKRWRAARSSQATHKRKGSAESRAEPWISLTDQHKLRRSPTKAAARAATAAALLLSLRRQLHVLLGWGPAMSPTMGIGPREPRPTGHGSKGVGSPAHAPNLSARPKSNTDGARTRTRCRPRPSWYPTTHPASVVRARRPILPRTPPKRPAMYSTKACNQPNGQVSAAAGSTKASASEPPTSAVSSKRC